MFTIETILEVDVRSGQTCQLRKKLNCEQIIRGSKSGVMAAPAWRPLCAPGQLHRRNVKRFRRGLVINAFLTFVSLDSRLESNKKKKKKCG